MDYEVCNTQPCNEVKKMGSWTPWMVQVNGSTGDGGQLERRFRFSCKANVPDANTLKVSLAKEETRVCHADGSCQRSGDGGDEAGWTDWGSWSQCSVECGGGQQFRIRTCERGSCDGTSKMARACNTHSCKGKLSVPFMLPSNIRCNRFRSLELLDGLVAMFSYVWFRKEISNKRLLDCWKRWM